MHVDILIISNPFVCMQKSCQMSRFLDNYRHSGLQIINAIFLKMELGTKVFCINILVANILGNNFVYAYKRKSLKRYNFEAFCKYYLDLTCLLLKNVTRHKFFVKASSLQIHEQQFHLHARILANVAFAR